MHDFELQKGELEIPVVKALPWRARHGSTVGNRNRTSSRTPFTIVDRPCYWSLHRLEKRDLVEKAWGVSENQFSATLKGGTA